MSADQAAADPPTLEADEARLAEVSIELAAAIIEAVPGWVSRIVLDRLGAVLPLDDGRAQRIDEIGSALAASLAEPVLGVLTADVDSGVGTPLALIRAAVTPVTELLHELGVAPSGRDPFAAEHFPDDHYDLGPPSFAAIDSSLHVLGLTWGAARAHVHLRRRREVAT